jgi:hypothetical protein
MSKSRYEAQYNQMQTLIRHKIEEVGSYHHSYQLQLNELNQKEAKCTPPARQLLDSDEKCIESKNNLQKIGGILEKKIERFNKYLTECDEQSKAILNMPPAEMKAQVTLMSYLSNPLIAVIDEYNQTLASREYAALPLTEKAKSVSPLINILKMTKAGVHPDELKLIQGTKEIEILSEKINKLLAMDPGDSKILKNFNKGLKENLKNEFAKQPDAIFTLGRNNKLTVDYEKQKLYLDDVGYQEKEHNVTKIVNELQSLDFASTKDVLLQWQEAREACEANIGRAEERSKKFYEAAEVEKNFRSHIQSENDYYTKESHDVAIECGTMAVTQHDQEGQETLKQLQARINATLKEIATKYAEYKAKTKSITIFNFDSLGDVLTDAKQKIDGELLNLKKQYEDMLVLMGKLQEKPLKIQQTLYSEIKILLHAVDLWRVKSGGITLFSKGEQLSVHEGVGDMLKVMKSEEKNGDNAANSLKQLRDIAAQNKTAKKLTPTTQQFYTLVSALKDDDLLNIQAMQNFRHQLQNFYQKYTLPSQAESSQSKNEPRPGRNSRI